MGLTLATIANPKNTTQVIKIEGRIAGLPKIMK
jgi:hypothetical protein